MISCIVTTSKFIFFAVLGGFAFVFIAQDISNGKEFALKVRLSRNKDSSIENRNSVAVVHYKTDFCRDCSQVTKKPVEISCRKSTFW